MLGALFSFQGQEKLFLFFVSFKELPVLFQLSVLDAFHRFFVRFLP